MKKTNKKKKINKKGFSKAEFMGMLAVVAILFAFGTKYVLDNTKSYGSFKTLANSFAKAVTQYKDHAPIPKNEYSLYEVEKVLDKKLTNPFDKSEECDKYESTVTLNNDEENPKSIKLICGKYVVEAVQGKSYKVYEVGDWEEEYTDGCNDGDILYNYKENGQLVLSDFVPTKSFIGIVSLEKGIKINDVKDINSNGRDLVTKPVYRTKELVKEFK